ncbi:MAG: hypothetical protein JXN62_02480, partial [Bacteroidales bacterium]|nr:hypothetical protein [Bacteroidales bacterium]
NKLLTNKFVTVIGASGSGKSSLINSGIIPKLPGIAAKRKPSWKVISLHPGNDPLMSLANAFAKSILADQDFDQSDKSVISHMEDNPDWIVSAMKNLILKPGEKVLVIIDQFEEVFGTGSDTPLSIVNEKAKKFAGLLENAIRQTAVEIYILISIRSDFVAECASFHGLIQLINNSSFLVPRMTRDNYKSVIENQLKYAGAEIDPKLVETILNDLGDQSDQLPVLQHLLMRTFSFWKEHDGSGRPIDQSDYSAVGTLSGAISRHADEAYNELSPERKDICRRLFQAITGKGSDNRGFRHPLAVGRIVSIIECGQNELTEVIEKFRRPSRSFIIPHYDKPLNDNTVIDLSHESIMRLWGRLKEWIDDEAASVRMYRRLSEASTMYQQGKTTLLKNPDLQLAINWREKQKPTVSWAERYDPAFERVMVYLRTSEKAALDEEQKKITRQRKKIRSNRIIASILGTAALISLGLMFVAFVQKKNSDRQRTDALKQKAAAVEYATSSERVAIASRLQLAIADSIAEAAKENEKGALYLRQISENRRSDAERAIIKAEMNAETAAAERELAMSKRMISVGKSMALKSLLLTGQEDLQTLLAYQGYVFNERNNGEENDADIYHGLYNLAKHYNSDNYKVFSGHVDEIKSIAFVPGGREFFTAGSDGKIMKWGLDNKKQSLQVIYSGSDIINVLAVSPDAGWLASGGQNSEIKMIPLQGTGIGYELKGHSGPVKSLIFSFDGKYLYSASSDGKVLKWDLSSKTSTNISINMEQITSIDLSPDNKYIAGINNEGKVVVWDPERSSDNFRIEAAGKVIRSVRFKPEDNILAIGYTDGYLEVWDISARKRISEVKAHKSEVNDIRFNSKLSQIATASNDGTLKLWNSSDFTALPVVFDDNEGIVVSIEFSPDGQVIVSGTSGKSNNLKGRASNSTLLAKDICTVVSRNFTLDEWMAYVGKDIGYEETCPDKQYNIRVREIKK